jgi:hypothetical protein
MIDDYRQSVCHLSFIWYDHDDVKHVDDMYDVCTHRHTFDREEKIDANHRFLSLSLSLG